MRESKLYTVRYTGYADVIGSTRMKFYRERTHVAEIEETYDGLTEVFIRTKTAGVMTSDEFFGEYKDEYTGSSWGTYRKTLMTMTNDAGFACHWDILDRRILIEKVGNTW